MIEKTLGHYRVGEQLGRGGMGEIYLADDLNLNRKVALKFLPEAFAADPERMARFEREAKLLASLNHPNIAAIYGLEQAEEKRFLVLELVEGETLAQRLSKGALPVEEALGICRQIAEGLEAAHEKGVIHRDLKPANVMITEGDKVKILDFGLAKALSDETQSIDSSQSPTLTEAMTRPGVILGTAAYMSPEQAKGKSVDKRADIWAFGCILYECLSGKKAFEGETTTETLAAVIKEAPSWAVLPALTPQNIRFVLHKCLEKERSARFRDAADIRILLDDLHDNRESTLSIKKQRSLLWKTVAVLFVVAFAVMVVLYIQKKQPVFSNLMRFQVNLPDKLSLSATRTFAISPDGRYLAFAAAGSDRVFRIWLHAFDKNEAKPLSGTESGWITSLFWSPDSRYIAFNVVSKLKKIDVNRKNVEIICSASSSPIGGSWNRDGEIIYGSINNKGIVRVSAEGGNPSPVSVPDPEKQETAHSYPIFLSDGQHFLFYCKSKIPDESGIYIGSLDLKLQEQRFKQVLATDSPGAAYIPSKHSDRGYLIFLSNRMLLARRFDEKQLKLIDDPIPLSGYVSSGLGVGLFSASTNGILVYGDFSEQKAQLTWFDRRGKIINAIKGAGTESLGLYLSPDDSRAAVSWVQDRSAEIRLLDFTGGNDTPFTFGGNSNGDPVWSPDGNEIIFASNANGSYDLYRKPVSGIKEERIFESNEFKIPTDWSSDGRFLLYRAQNDKGNYNLWVLPLENKAKPFPFMNTEFNEGGGQFSPDMRWIAYTSNKTGIDEVYVSGFSPASAGPSMEAKGIWPISEGGGTEPRWGRKGRELYYQTPDGKVMAVEIAAGKVFRNDKPKELFQIPLFGGSGIRWDVTSDGNRFLMVTPTKDSTPSTFNVILNWTSLLER